MCCVVVVVVVLQAGDEAMEVKVRRSGGSRTAAGAAMAAGQRPRQSSRRAAAAGVAAAVRAAAAAGEGAFADPAAAGAAAPGYTMGFSHSPSPSFSQQHWEGAPKAAGGSRSGGRARAGSSGRGSSRALDDDEDDYELMDDEESEEGLAAWDADEDEDGACFGRVVLGGGYTQNDYSNLSLKPDHYNRPLWVCSDGRIFLETYSPIYKQVCVFQTCNTKLCSQVPSVVVCQGKLWKGAACMQARQMSTLAKQSTGG